MPAAHKHWGTRIVAHFVYVTGTTHSPTRLTMILDGGFEKPYLGAHSSTNPGIMTNNY